jgi:hypothetical protein
MEWKPEGVQHWLLAAPSAGRLTSVMSSGAAPRPPWSKRRRLPSGPGWAGKSPTLLFGSVVSPIGFFLMMIAKFASHPSADADLARH